MLGQGGDGEAVLHREQGDSKAPGMAGPVGRSPHWTQSPRPALEPGSGAERPALLVPTVAPAWHHGLCACRLHPAVPGPCVALGKAKHLPLCLEML